MSLQYGRSKTFYLLSLFLSAGAMITGQIESSEGTITVRHAHYSAARGTLPSEQGFRVVDSDPDHPPVSVTAHPAHDFRCWQYEQHGQITEMPKNAVFPGQSSGL